MTRMSGDRALAASDRAVESIRTMIVSGELRSGDRISEEQMADQLAISRNTLREAFRVLRQSGLLVREPNRGAFVATLDADAITDIYRVRRVIETDALRQGHPHHPGAIHMREAVDRAMDSRAAEDWAGVGTANMAFHEAIIELTDSPRLSAMMAMLTAELRLAFGQIDDAEQLHVPYVAENAAIVELVEAYRMKDAATRLDRYLTQSERYLLGAIRRAKATEQRSQVSTRASGKTAAAKTSSPNRAERKLTTTKAGSVRSYDPVTS